MNSEEIIRTFLKAETGNEDRHRAYSKVPEKLYWKSPAGNEHQVRELLLSEDIESATLIQEKVSDYVNEGAKPYVCAREACMFISGIKSNAYRHIKGAAGTYAAEVSEGAEIPHLNQDYDKADVAIKKYGVNAAITEEMIEDGLVDVMMYELKYAGEAMENALNREWITQLLDDAGNEHDCAGSNLGRSAVLSAKALVEADHFRPDTIVLCPEAANLILRDYTTAYTETGEAVMQKGMLPSIGGMKPYVLGVEDNTTNYAWEYNDNSDIGMIVLEKDKAAVIAMNRDITVKEMKDPVHDLVNLPVTMRVGVESVHANAICRVEY